MRRFASAVAALAVLAGAVLALGADGDRGEGRAYVVELDNAFGIVEGADFKVAGVRAGTVEEMRLDRRSHRALVTVRVTRPGFGSLRRDAFCETRPQSLIGEYFIDCAPGKDRELPEGARIPVERTGSTVPLDLVGNIQRRPVRERLRLIVGELGAGVAARGPELNAAIRRAVPALRETSEVLEILADDNRVLERLVRDGDRALRPLAERREDVTRFVREAGESSGITASRSRALRRQFEKLPGFLRELRPTMAALGRTADAQAASFAELRRTAPRLERFLDELGPFAERSEPAVASLAGAARRGRRAVEPAAATVRALAGAADGLPELARNLAIVLEHEDDRRNAVEPDPRSPGGEGYTGLEAFLTYFRDQSQAINIFDRNVHILKVALYANHCGPYATAEIAEEKPECNAYLGPNQPGITSPDFDDRTGRPARARAARGTRRARGKGGHEHSRPSTRRPAPAPGGAAPAGRPSPAPSPTPDARVPQIDPPQLPQLPSVPGLFDFLLGP